MGGVRLVEQLQADPGWCGPGDSREERRSCVLRAVVPHPRIVGARGRLRQVVRQSRDTVIQRGIPARHKAIDERADGRDHAVYPCMSVGTW